MSFDSSSVLAVGTVAFDTIKTPFGLRERIVGGAGTYIGWSASTLGVRTGLVSVVGDDFSQEELTRMENAGMLVEGIERKEGEKSFFWSGSYHTDMNGRDTLETELNVLADFKPVIPAQWKGAQWLMLGNIDPSLQASVLDMIQFKLSLWKITLELMTISASTKQYALKKRSSKLPLLDLKNV